MIPATAGTQNTIKCKITAVIKHRELLVVAVAGGSLKAEVAAGV